MNPIKKKIKMKMLKAAAKKSEAAMPKLKGFAITHDVGYDALVKNLRDINEDRKKVGKYFFNIDKNKSK